MGRFVNLGVAIVNTDYIIRVETDSSGRAEIYMSDGTMFRCDNFNLADLYGAKHIVSLVSCDGVDALYHTGKYVTHVPLHALAVMANGEVKPLHGPGEKGEEADYGRFIGISDRG